MDGVQTSETKSILKQLYVDSRQSPEDIADIVGLDSATVRNKISQWESSELISDPVAVVDPGKIGYPLMSYHLINFQKNYDYAIDRGLRQFSKWPGTQLAMVVLGDYDVIARKVSQSESKLDIFATNVLSNPDSDIKEEFGPQTSQLFDIETVKVTQTIRRNGIDIPDSKQRSDDNEIEISNTEAAVIRCLQSDARLREKPEEIAAEVAATSRSEVEKTIERLEDLGIITKYSRRIDPDAGEWYRAFFAISVERGRYEDVVEELTKESKVSVPFIQSGLGYNWADIFTELLIVSIEELDTITDRLRSIDGVKSSRTFLGTRSPYFDEKVEMKR